MLRRGRSVCDAFNAACLSNGRFNDSVAMNLRRDCGEFEWLSRVPLSFSGHDSKLEGRNAIYFTCTNMHPETERVFHRWQ